MLKFKYKVLVRTVGGLYEKQQNHKQDRKSVV